MGAIQQWFNRILELISAEKVSSGKKAEKFAAYFLKKQGLKLIQHNFSTKIAEIDLVMKHADTLVFIEVKFRTESDWADAVETVTKAKQQKIIKAAKQYRQKHKISDNMPCRFDVVAIKNELKAENTEWLQHAFY